MSLLRRPIDVVWSRGLPILAGRYGLSFQPRACALVWALTTTAWALITSPVPAAGVKVVREALALVDRTVTQDQGAWIIDYRLRHTGSTGVIVTPEEIAVKVEGWVSNSRVASHAMPRWSSLVIARRARSIDNFRGDRRSRREPSMPRTINGIRVDRRPTSSHDTLQQRTRRREKATQMTTITPAESLVLLPLSLSPGSIVRVRLRLEHQHIIYGDYDVLLAIRAISLSLGSVPVRDVVPLDREHYLGQPRFSWIEPPEDRRDTRHSVSAPDSLHLKAHVPGHNYYRYAERPVRYNTKMRLRFWYLIATGTEGECKVKVGQYKETPISWRQLNSGGFEQCLKNVGRWTKVERSYSN